MLVTLGSVVGAYAGIAGALFIRRVLKLIDLYEEYQFIRSREQKAHIKMHAIILRNDYKSDLLWGKTLIKNLKSVREWLKTA